MSGGRTPRRGGDAVLLGAAAQGDRAAWDELVSRHAQQVWDVARGYGLDVAASADVCAVTWSRCVDRLGASPAIDDLAGWLTDTTSREARRAAAAAERAPLAVTGTIHELRDLQPTRGVKPAS